MTEETKTVIEEILTYLAEAKDYTEKRMHESWNEAHRSYFHDWNRAASLTQASCYQSVMGFIRNKYYPHESIHDLSERLLDKYKITDPDLRAGLNEFAESSSPKEETGVTDNSKE